MSGSRMTLTVLMMMTLLPLMPGSGGTKQKPAISYMMSPANTVSCRDKDKRLLEEVENAQLAAHRCMIRDVAVKVPEPDDFIAESVFPSHIIVPRCSGLCLDQLGGTCLPKRQPKIISHQVVFYDVNGTQSCRKIDLEHHRSPCRCACLLTASDCSPRQMFDPSKCECHCDKSNNAAKYTCALDPRRTWDESQCACVCRATCLPGQEMEPGTCTCLPVSIATCSIAPVSLSTSHPAKIATYIGLIALTVLGLTIAVTLYYIVIRRPVQYRDLTDYTHSHAATPNRASYKITINQSHSELDTEAELQLQENLEEKTKF